MTKKKLLIIFVLVISVPIAWWLLSPLWRDVTLNEELPMINDNLETMTAAMKEEFTEQTEAMQEKVMEGEDAMPGNEQKVISSAAMIARAHDVQGKALIVKVGDEYFLRFENLETINGPDLRIYLSADLSNDDIVDLGPIRATQGNVNYTIPPGTDLSKYKNAMIWCRAFSVLFSYAQL